MIQLVCLVLVKDEQLVRLVLAKAKKLVCLVLAEDEHLVRLDHCGQLCGTEQRPVLAVSPCVIH